MTYSIYESISNPTDFPVNAFVAAIESSTLHWHNEYEMIGVLKGSIEIRVQSEVFTLGEQDVLLINSSRIHALKALGGQTCICMIVQMNTSLFGTEDEKIEFYLNSTREPAPKCEYAVFRKQMARIVAASMKEDRCAQFRLRADACILIADLFEYTVYDSCYSDGVSVDEQELVISFIDYANDHLEEEKILEYGCRALGVSRKTLDRNIKSFLGMTSKEIVDNLRLEKAKGLLKNTGKRMDYIIDVCGFGSEKSFYRIFKKKTGLTPKDFREKGSMEHYDNELKGYLDFEIPMARELLNRVIED